LVQTSGRPAHRVRRASHSQSGGPREEKASMGGVRFARPGSASVWNQKPTIFFCKIDSPGAAPRGVETVSAPGQPAGRRAAQGPVSSQHPFAGCRSPSPAALARVDQHPLRQDRSIDCALPAAARFRSITGPGGGGNREPPPAGARSCRPPPRHTPPAPTSSRGIKAPAPSPPPTGVRSVARKETGMQVAGRETLLIFAREYGDKGSSGPPVTTLRPWPNLPALPPTPPPDHLVAVVWSPRKKSRKRW